MKNIKMIIEATELLNEDELYKVKEMINIMFDKNIELNTYTKNEYISSEFAQEITDEVMQNRADDSMSDYYQDR